MEEITILDVKPQIVLGMRKRGAYQEIPIMIRTIYEFAVNKNIEIAGGPLFLWHEKTVEEAKNADRDKNADIEIAWPISKKAEVAGEIKCYKLPGGKMARLIHKGPYEDCGPAYERLFAWLETNKKRLAGPIREVYLNDPSMVSSEEILTEIYAPID